MKEITTPEFEKEVLEAEKVIVDFYSTECPPCEALASKYDELSGLYGNEIRFLKVYRQQNRELADQLGIKSSPTLLFFGNGKEIAPRLNGGIKRSDIIRNLNSMITTERAGEIKSGIKPKVTETEVIILGGGPGGLTAGLYLGQSKIKTVLIDPGLPGGNVAITHEVSNYPGFIQPQPGYMLSHNMSEQTKQSGVDYRVAVDITRVDLEKKEVVIDDYETIRAKKIVISTGTTPHLTGATGEKELKGRGISYCATCDAKYYEGKEVVVIGGGNSAVEESEYITRFASKLTIVHQFDTLTANRQAQEKAFKNPKISVIYNNEPRAFSKDGDKIVTEVENVKTGERQKLVSDGIFIFIGMKPNTGLLGDKLDLDRWGYIATNDDRMTSIPGVYAAGDIVSKKYRQITTAVSDGTIAAMAIAKELDLE
ncbi:MAG: FAD-dependent oxidoreductase [Bacteroidales bacterium]